MNRQDIDPDVIASEISGLLLRQNRNSKFGNKNSEPDVLSSEWFHNMSKIVTPIPCAEIFDRG